MTATANVTMPAGATPPASPRDTRVKKRRQGRFGDRVLPYALLLPGVAAILVLLAWPLVQVLAISFRKLDVGQLISGKTVWIGFDNYTKTLSDPEFWTITFRTLVFTASIVAATIVGGLLLAVLMRHLGPVIRVILQVTLVLAWATPVIATTTVFQWIFDEQYGILNKTLDRLGFPGFIGFSWFSSGASTLTVIGLLIVWQAVPFVTFSLYAGLIGVPQEQYEAAGMDGAGPWQTFRAVTWPSIAPITTMVTFLSVLWDFNAFAQIWAIREGGPDGESTTLAVVLYLKGIAGNHFGAAGAIATLMLILLALITGRYIQLLVRTPEGELK
ncbi:sugar ABC transporter permease [Streptomyces sp. MN03-5084-2B]|nr:sugar ABC transporter permease [Streptomyces sp. MN03-5084-2B]